MFLFLYNPKIKDKKVKTNKEKSYVNVCLVGWTGSGKSLFLSRLFGVKSDVAASSKYAPTFDEISHLKLSLVESDSNKKLKDAENEYGYIKFKRENYSKCIEKTDEDINVEDFSYSVNDLVYTYYDNPGEKLKNLAECIGNVQKKELENVAKNEDYSNAYNKLTNADVIMLLLNKEEKENELGEVFEMIKEIKKNKPEKKIVVLFSCFDKFEDLFLTNCHVRFATEIPMFSNSKTRYRKSNYSKYINICSEEIRAICNDIYHSEIDGTIVDKFFCFSSIGQQNSIYPDLKKNLGWYKYIASSRGIENIVIWLAYAFGILK